MLAVDAAINLILGFLLIIFPLEVFQFLGLPIEVPPFYANVLGAVLVGIGVALLTEHLRGSGRMVGLGLGGAIIINLYVGLLLTIWLLSSKLSIPLRGRLILWGLVIVLAAISGLEGFVHLKRKDSRDKANATHQRS